MGTAYDKTPIQDEFRSPRLPDESRVWLALGAQWQFSKQGALDFGYAHEFVDDASSQLVSAAPPSAPQGNLYGTYKLNVNIVGVQLRYNVLTRAVRAAERPPSGGRFRSCREMPGRPRFPPRAQRRAGPGVQPVGSTGVLRGKPSVLDCRRVTSGRLRWHPSRCP